MKNDERLELDVGTPLALRAVVEHWQHRVALRVYYDGVVFRGVSAADALAERFRHEPWEATSIATPLQVVHQLSALLDKAEGELVDVCGVITAVEVRAADRRPVTFLV